MNNKENGESGIEQMLRRGDWIEPMGEFDLDKVISRSTKRRRMRRATVASIGAAAAVMSVIGGAQLLAGSPNRSSRHDEGDPAASLTTSSPSSVPWTNSKAPAAIAPSDCAKGALSIGLGRSGAWHGQESRQIEIRNTSGADCTIAGHMTIAAVSATQGNLPASGATSVSSTVLSPKQALIIMLGSDVSCGSATAKASALSISLAAVSATLQNADIPVNCGAPSVIEVYAEPVEPATESLELSAVVSAPDVVKAGSPLRYTVTLTNSGVQAISLDNCPTYLEGLKATGISASYVLNCAQSPTIDAGTSRSFDMVLDIPAGSQPGTALLTWSLTNYRASASAAVTIE